MKTTAFSTALYFSQYEIMHLESNNAWIWFEEKLKWLLDRMPVHRIYLETHRSGHYVPKEVLLHLKDLCQKYDLEVAGGITLTTSNSNALNTDLFTTYCYSTPEDLDAIKKAVRYTAELFDLYILDDFFFTHCKCPHCIEEKKDLTWAQYRIKLLEKVSKEIIIPESKAVNPNVQVIIKYPNWYEEYQQSGYNLEMGATALFDGIYAGTETRDPVHTQQNLQPYSSYFVMRYLENVRPGGNLGGWFDTLDCSYNLNRIAEQAYLTLFSKAKEATVYSIGTLLTQDLITIPVLGYTFEAADQLVPSLGTPIGVAAYKPFHSSGENYLHGSLGMLGIPLEPTPYFPMEASTLLLTASSACDEKIIDKLKHYLQNNRTLIVTSGFIKSMSHRGLEEIMDIKATEATISSNAFGIGWHNCSYEHYCNSKENITFPILEFSTNDTQNTIAALVHQKGYPILLQTNYANSKIYVLNIPNEYGALVDLPQALLGSIRNIFLSDYKIKVDGPAPLNLFLYDNNTLILYNFTDYAGNYLLTIDKDCQLQELTGRYPLRENISDHHTVSYKIKMDAKRFMAFKITKR